MKYRLVYRSGDSFSGSRFMTGFETRYGLAYCLFEINIEQNLLAHLQFLRGATPLRVE